MPRVRSIVVILLPAAIVTTLGPSARSRAAELAEPGEGMPFAQALVDLCSLLALVLSLWLLLVTVLGILTGLCASGTACDRFVRRLTPQAWRAAVATLVGASVLVAPAAHAGDGTAGVAPPNTALSGLRLPDLPSGELPDVDALRPASAARTIVVHRHDTLWALATASVRDSGRHPNPARIRRACDRLYAANRDVVGDDPDLIFPGMVLHLPPDLNSR